MQGDGQTPTHLLVIAPKSFVRQNGENLAYMTGSGNEIMITAGVWPKRPALATRNETAGVWPT